MLKFGYWLMMTAGALLGGYIAYFLIRLLITAPGIGTFFKVVILIGAVGLIITIIGLRFTTSQTMSGAAEILAYGTAVRLEE